MKTRSGLYVPGAPIAAKVSAGPIGHRRNGRAMFAKVLRTGLTMPATLLTGGAMTAAGLRDAGRATPSAPAQQQPAVPFVRGSREFVEGPFLDETITPGAAATSTGIAQIPIPARGWMTNIRFEVTMSGGVLGAGALSEDWPFCVFDGLTLSRPNGDPYFGPMAGFSAFLANLYGGYEFQSDPRLVQDPTVGFLGSINARFVLRVPVEITHHDAYGALINQDQAASYRIGWTVPASTVLFPTAPTTIPAVRFRAFLEGWEQPPAVDLSGRPVAQAPPGTPTAQFWSEQVFDIEAGLNTVRLTDVGNLLRVLAFVYRDNTATRIRRDDELPQDSLRLTYSARDLENNSLRGWRDVMHRRYGVVAPAGVLIYDKIHDGEGHAGNESRNQYLATSDATRIELVGSFGGDGGILTVLTNDVAPAGVPVS